MRKFYPVEKGRFSARLCKIYAVKVSKFLVCCCCNSLNIKEQKVSNKIFVWILFCYFCEMYNQGKARQTKRGKLLENFFWKNFVCKTKAILVDNENISVVAITITWAPGILRVTINNVKAYGCAGAQLSWGSGAL